MVCGQSLEWSMFEVKSLIIGNVMGLMLVICTNWSNNFTPIYEDAEAELKWAAPGTEVTHWLLARLFIVGIICHPLSIRSRENFYFLKPSWCTNSGRLVIYRNTAAIIVTLMDLRTGWHTLSSRYQMSGLFILDEAELSRNLTCLARAITTAGVGGSLCAAQTGLDYQVTTASRLSTPSFKHKSSLNLDIWSRPVFIIWKIDQFRK